MSTNETDVKKTTSSTPTKPTPPATQPQQPAPAVQSEKTPEASGEGEKKSTNQEDSFFYQKPSGDEDYIMALVKELINFILEIQEKYTNPLAKKIANKVADKLGLKDAYNTVKDKVNQALDKATDKLNQARDNMAEKLDQARGNVTEKLDQAYNKVVNTMDNVRDEMRDTLSQGYGEVTNKLDQAYDEVKNKLNQAYDKIDNRLKQMRQQEQIEQEDEIELKELGLDSSGKDDSVIPEQEGDIELQTFSSDEATPPLEASSAGSVDNPSPDFAGVMDDSSTKTQSPTSTQSPTNIQSSTSEPPSSPDVGTGAESLTP